MRSIEEAIAEISSPGQPFEVVTQSGSGHDVRAFKNAPATLREFFQSARGLDGTFIVYEDEEWSFARVMDEVDALAAGLVERLGVRHGDRVGIAMRNYPEWVMAFAAITSIGAVSVSLNAWWTSDEMAYAIDDAGISVLIGDAERVERTQSVCEERKVILVGARMSSVPDGVLKWDDVVMRGAPMPEANCDAETDATILYTSGTTGFPKGAVSTHGAISQAVMAFASGAAIQAARREADESGSGNQPVFILIVPLFHVTGCVPVMLSCFCWHFKLVMMYRWEPTRALELIERHRVTNFVGVPTQSWDLMESPDFASYDTSSLSAIGGGGAPAPPTLVARVGASFRRGGPTLGYGMTETNAYGPGNYGPDYLAHPTSTGRVPTIIMDVEIRDEIGRTLDRGEQGEIWLKSPTLIRGYWNRPDATAEALREGWLSTGDLGYIDDEGFLYIQDRAKDMIIRGGENIYCAEVESAIYELPDVYEAAVFGLPDERLGEEVACVVMRRPGSTLESDEVRAHVAARVAAFKVPVYVAITEVPLPRNPAGKFLKREMPARYFATKSSIDSRA